MIKIGVDLISGESDMRELALGCVDAVKEDKDIEVVIIGKSDVFEPLVHVKEGLFGKPKRAERISFMEASDVITMDDDPRSIYKQKKNSSIVVGLQAHKEAKIDAFFSPGNTGAIVVASSLILGRVKGIKKPALASLFPTTDNSVNLLLDVGASAVCEVEDLVKFAVMGRAYYRAVTGEENPRIALLNIGSESHKGTDTLKNTYQALSKVAVNFVGNVEGRDICTNMAEVIICDGTIGNTALKTAEGIAEAINHILKASIKSSFWASISIPLYMSALKKMKNAMDPEYHGGAPLLGVKGNVFIGHGSSGRKAIKYGIFAAAKAVRGDVLGRIHSRLEELGLESGHISEEG